MTKQLTLEQLATRAYEQFIKGLENEKPDHIPMPVWFVQSGIGLTIMGTPWAGDDDEKDQMAHAVRQTLKTMGAESYVFVNEVWFLRVHRNEDLSRMARPSQAEGRQEAVLVQGEDRKGTVIARMAMIDRGPDGKRKIGPLQDTDADGFGGRFAHMFEDA